MISDLHDDCVKIPIPAVRKMAIKIFGFFMIIKDSVIFSEIYFRAIFQPKAGYTHRKVSNAAAIKLKI